MTNDKEGAYCSICGGISPSQVTTKRILIGEKEIGIEKLDQIIDEVRGMNLSDDAAIRYELLRRTKASNYVPTKLSNEYGETLLKEYKRMEG
jgi:hypothetical protein